MNFLKQTRAHPEWMRTCFLCLLIFFCCPRIQTGFHELTVKVCSRQLAGFFERVTQFHTGEHVVESELPVFESVSVLVAPDSVFNASPSVPSTMTEGLWSIRLRGRARIRFRSRPPSGRTRFDAFRRDIAGRNPGRQAYSSTVSFRAARRNQVRRKFPVWLRCIPEIHRVGEDHIAFPDLVSALSRDPHAFFKTASGIK